MKTAIILSGGMDSTSIAFWKKPDLAITIDYGQGPAEGEVRASRAVCKELNIKHIIVECDLSRIGSGDLAGNDALEIASAPEWWPFRNQMLVTVSAMAAVSYNVDKLLLGCLKTDNFHKDSTSHFIKLMNEILMFQEGNISLEAPAIEMSAAELVIKSEIPFQILNWSHSCHVSNYACGTCRGCQKHYETIRELGFEPF